MVSSVPDRAGYVILAFRLLFPSTFIFGYKVKNSLSAGSLIPVETLSALSFVPGVDFSDHRPSGKWGILPS